MAVRKFLLTIGQSNGNAVADAESWEALHPQIAIRSPSVTSDEAPQVSYGSYNDLFTMPDDFPGFDAINCKGLAVQKIRYLTFYNPCGTYQFASPVAQIATYPGLSRVAPTTEGFQIDFDQGVRGPFIVDSVVGWGVNLGRITKNVSSADGTPNTFVWNATFFETIGHGLPEGTRVFVATTGTLPPGLSPATSYYVVVVNADRFQLSTTPDGLNPVTPPNNGTGTHTYTPKQVTGTLVITKTSGDDILNNQSFAQATSGFPGAVVNGIPVDVTIDNECTVDLIFQYSQAGKTFVRQSTGVTHTIVAHTINTQLFAQITPVFDPPLISGEQIEYTIAAGALPGGGNDATRLLLGPLFGALPNGTAGTPGVNEWMPYSLTGLWVKCLTAPTSAANVGLLRQIETSNQTGGKSEIRLASAFPEDVTVGDTFELVAIQDGEEVEFHKWAYWLPWCPFEGRAFPWINTVTFSEVVLAGPLLGALAISASLTGGYVNAPVRITSVAGVSFVFDSTADVNVGTDVFTETSHGMSNGQRVQVAIETTAFPTCTPALATGTTYYVVNVTTHTFQLALTVGGTPITIDVAQVGTVRVTLYSKLPSNLTSGATYYIHTAFGSAVAIATTAGGAFITWTDDGVGALGTTLEYLMQEGKHNPFPTGFNYENHSELPGLYQPYSGMSIAHAANADIKISYHVGLAVREAEALGEDVYVASVHFPGSALGHREIVGDAAVGVGWHDWNQQISWAPGEQNGCYARLLDVLAAGITAAAAEGDTLELLHVVYLQGEEDAVYEHLADRFENNWRGFKNKLREDIKALGLWPGPASTIQIVDMKIPDDGSFTYAETVNAAKVKVAREDPYIRLKEVEDEDGVGLIDKNPSPDQLHDSGTGATTREGFAYEAWLDMQRDGTTADIDVCNLALAHIGNKARVTSVFPSDGSHEADLCNRYYEIAVKATLALHSWKFALEKRELVQVNVDDDGVTTTNDNAAYLYRYEIPSDCLKALTVLDGTATNDYLQAGNKVPQDFSPERSPDDRRMRIYSNQEDAFLRYTILEQDSTQWDTLFLMALSWHLASMLAGPIIKGDQGAAEAKRCLEVMSRYLALAAVQDSGERQVTLDRKAAQIRARG